MLLIRTATFDTDFQLVSSAELRWQQRCLDTRIKVGERAFTFAATTCLEQYRATSSLVDTPLHLQLLIFDFHLHLSVYQVLFFLETQHRSETAWRLVTLMIVILATTTLATMKSILTNDLPFQ